MFYNSKDLTDPESREVFSHLVDDAETVREYVGLYESAPQMKPKDVQNYRKLSEYGDVVFAGMYSQKHGFMFCSWRQSDGGKYVAHGNYSPDYLVSKENYAVRAGLVDNNKLFTKEEAEELFKCAAFARDNCESLTYEQDRGLMELMEKLQTAYPHLKDNPPTFDDGEGLLPQLQGFHRCADRHHRDTALKAVRPIRYYRQHRLQQIGAYGLSHHGGLL